MPANIVITTFIPIQEQAIKTASRKSFMDLSKVNEHMMSHGTIMVGFIMIMNRVTASKICLSGGWSSHE